jgi:putative copper export protein
VEHDAAPLPLDLFALGRGLAFAATLALVGSALFLALIPRWRAEDDDDQTLAARSLAATWPWAFGAAVLLLVAHLLRGFGQVRSFLEPGEPITWEVARPILVSTAWGGAWVIQVASAVLALVAVRLAPRRPAVGVGLVGTAALLVAGTTPLTGHATEHPWGTSLGVGLHTLHLLGGGIWLGTLATIFVAGIRLVRNGGDHRALARLITVFSPIALAGAGLAIVAGLLLSLAYVGTVANLLGTSYGRVVLIKVTVLAIVMGFGAWNWRRLLPTLGTPSASARLRRSAAFELTFALVLVAVTAILVALPAPAL